MQIVLHLWLDWDNHFADVFKYVSCLLKVAVATLNQTQALLDEVMLVSVILGVQLLENAIDLVFAVCDLLVLDQHEFLES